MTTLSDAVEAILTEIVDAVSAASNDPGSGLEEVRAVVRGDRARPMPELPAVWVVPQPATVEQSEFGDEEMWGMPVTLAALVKADSPEEGGEKAQRIAARAAAVAKTIRPEVGSFVIDVRMAGYDAAARTSERNRSLYWTDATVRVTFSAD